MDSIEFFSKEYCEESWKKYSALFNETGVYLVGIPHDIVNVVLAILGNETGRDWLQNPISRFEGKTVKDLLGLEKGEKALKAFIMRLLV